jgi:hypothetical protein
MNLSTEESEESGDVGEVRVFGNITNTQPPYTVTYDDIVYVCLGRPDLVTKEDREVLNALLHTYNTEPADLHVSCKQETARGWKGDSANVIKFLKEYDKKPIARKVSSRTFKYYVWSRSLGWHQVIQNYVLNMQDKEGKEKMDEELAAKEDKKEAEQEK